VVTAVAPDAIAHLAAVTAVSDAEADPQGAYRTNVGGTLTLLDAIRALAPAARVLFVGSSAVYGEPASGAPITEDAPLQPRTVYGASKAAAEIAAGQWGRAYGLDVRRVRAFNHTGAGQDPRFVCAALARQVARIEAGLQPPVLEAGNLDPVRDFSDVRDVAAAYVAVLERGAAGAVYNVCSGAGVSIAEVVAVLRTHARVPLRAHSDAALRRRIDVPRLVGNADRLRAETGWSPAIPLDETLAWVLDDWRRRVAAEHA
jgi:GDP-4-dehydro-6-deoxy-D-mannose reductase